MSKTQTEIDVKVNFQTNTLTVVTTKKKKLFGKFFVVDSDSGGFSRIEPTPIVGEFFMCDYLRGKYPNKDKLINKHLISLKKAREIMKKPSSGTAKWLESAR